MFLLEPVWITSANSIFLLNLINLIAMNNCKHHLWKLSVLIQESIAVSLNFRLYHTINGISLEQVRGMEISASH